MFNDKRIVVTGGFGFIGSHLVKKLSELGAQVHIFSRGQSDNWRLINIKGKVFCHEVDLENFKDLTKTIKKINPQIIYHLASYGGHYKEQDFKKIIDINLIGTINLLKSLEKINFEFFVNTGSSSEYGIKKIPMKETDILEPVSFYGATKASTSLLGMAFFKNLKKPIATIRPFTVYGPFDSPNKLIPTAIMACLTKKGLKLTSGTEKHDYIFIDDIINAYLKVPMVSKISGEVINIGSGKQYSNMEVADLISKICNKVLVIEKGKYKRHYWDSNFWVADNSKARKLLKWEPIYSFETGLKNTIEWFKNNLKYYEC